MVLYTRRSKRKQTGKRYVENRKKKKRNLGGIQKLCTPGEEKIIITRRRGANKVSSVAHTKYAVVNVTPTTKKKVKIKIVKENSASQHFVRINALTKGAVVDSDIGLIKVTSRPSRHGVVNAVLVEKK